MCVSCVCEKMGDRIIGGLKLILDGGKQVNGTEPFDPHDTVNPDFYVKYTDLPHGTLVKLAVDDTHPPLDDHIHFPESTVWINRSRTILGVSAPRAPSRSFSFFSF